MWSFASFETDFPGWANGIGWLMIIFSLSFIPSFAILALANKNWDIRKVFIDVLKQFFKQASNRFPL